MAGPGGGNGTGAPREPSKIAQLWRDNLALWAFVLIIMNIFLIAVIFGYVAVLNFSGGGGQRTQHLDALKAAAELGRLDAIVILLTVYIAASLFAGVFAIKIWQERIDNKIEKEISQIRAEFAELKENFDRDGLSLKVKSGDRLQPPR